MGRYGNPDSAPLDPNDYEDDRRSSLPGQKIPGINEEKLGYPNWGNNPEKPDTVVLMHPEVAGTYKANYDNNDPFLGSSPERIDQNYVSPEDIRRRSKGSSW